MRQLPVQNHLTCHGLWFVTSDFIKTAERIIYWLNIAILANSLVQAALEKDFEKYRREQRAALSNRLRKRRAAKEEALRNAGATKAETASAWKSLDFDDER